jgi:hypothetical protein
MTSHLAVAQQLETSVFHCCSNNNSGYADYVPHKNKAIDRQTWISPEGDLHSP